MLAGKRARVRRFSPGSGRGCPGRRAGAGGPTGIDRTGPDCAEPETGNVRRAKIHSRSPRGPRRRHEMPGRASSSRGTTPAQGFCTFEPCTGNIAPQPAEVKHERRAAPRGPVESGRVRRRASGSAFFQTLEGLAGSYSRPWKNGWADPRERRGGGLSPRGGRGREDRGRIGRTARSGPDDADRGAIPSRA
jgi:hypothetical protein